jgi:hypothetical protein
MDVGSGAEVEVARTVDDVAAVDDVTVVVGAAEPPSSPHVGNSTAMPNTADIDTAFRNVVMPPTPWINWGHSIKLERKPR